MRSAPSSHSVEAATIVTGAASGLGMAVADLLRSRGQRVVGWDRSFGRSSAGQQQVEVTDEASVKLAWDETVNSCGRIAGLVNAAGIWTTGPIEDTSLEMWDRELDVNLRGSFLTARLAVPHMRSNGGGAIVNIASLAALRPPRIPSAAYAASKGGVVSFTRALASEGGPAGIRSNCISPGAIDTPMLTRTLDPESIQRYSGQSALGRLGQPDEVARVVAFLLGEDSSFVNGANIEVTGG